MINFATTYGQQLLAYYVLDQGLHRWVACDALDRYGNRIGRLTPGVSLKIKCPMVAIQGQVVSLKVETYIGCVGVQCRMSWRKPLTLANTDYYHGHYTNGGLVVDSKKTSSDIIYDDFILT